MFSVRAVTLDHYVGKLIPEVYEKNDSNISRHWLEPVIRIFGSTPDGIKSCVHVHGVFPYIYVPYKGGVNPDRDALIIGAALDEALKMTFNQTNYKYVYKVTVTSGIPLYGYHSGQRQFFKIFFYNPFYIRKASELLLNGAILEQKLQPHEAHIPYVLQFMIDYNIYGMNFVTFSKVKFRQNPENPESLLGINKGAVFSNKVKRMTESHFELDAFAMDIVNKENLRGLRTNPGLQAIWRSEKIRRRNQNKSSQFTLEESLPRKFEKIYATELMYKERLAAKLKEISLPKTISSVESDEPKLTYPAEVPEINNLLEASILDDVENHSQSNFRQEFPDASIFINEKILSQMENVGEEKMADESEEVEEAGSVLDKKEEEGAEPESDDGGDMTQPLELDEEEDVICDSDSDGQGSNSGKVKAFWNSMADRILQIDGAQDSSSDSDATNTKAINCVLEKEIDADSSRCFQNSSNESTMNNFFPALNDMGSSTFWSNFSPRMDGSWLPENQETWIWDKNEINFSDYLPQRNQNVDVCDFSATCKLSDDVISGDSLGIMFAGNQLLNGYGELDGLSLSSSNLESNYSESSFAMLNPSSGPDGGNVVEIDETTSEMMKKSFPDSKDGRNLSDCERATETGTDAIAIGSRNDATAGERIIRNVTENFESGNGKTETKTVSLTLKQYLKDFGEIVNVALKNFRDREMVVVEYKPFAGSDNSRSKFLIKPLDKFLENWNNAEKKINGELIDGSETNRQSPRESEKKQKYESNRGKLNNNSNNNNNSDGGRKKNGGEVETSSLKFVNNEFFKSVKISRKTCNENRGRENEDSVTRRQFDDWRIQNGDSFESDNLIGGETFKNPENVESVLSQNSRISSKYKFVPNPKADCKNYSNEVEYKNKCGSSNSNGDCKTRVRTKRKESKIRKIDSKNLGEIEEEEEAKNLSKMDVKLINQINSCFEDYFKNIVKVNNCFVSNGNNFLRPTSGSTKEDAGGNVKCGRSKKEDSGIRKSLDSEKTGLEFVSHLLSIFSRMSRKTEIPPLSITINIGNGSTESLPVRMNLKQTINAKSESKRETKRKWENRNGKLKIQNVDGPDDGSSSDEKYDDSSSSSSSSSSNVFSTRRNRTDSSRRKTKRDKNYYKSLNVILQKSGTGSERRIARKRKGTRHSMDGADAGETISGRRDSFDVSSKNQLKSVKCEGKSFVRSIRNAKVCDKSLKKSEGNRGKVERKWENVKVSKPEVVEIDSTKEPDIIYDSDIESFESRTSKSRRRKKCLGFKSRKIQDDKVDVETVKTSVVLPEKISSTLAASRIPSGDSRDVSDLEISISALDKTMYRIPPKWHDSTNNEIQRCSSSSSVEKTGATSSQCLSLSGSPLCSPAGNSSYLERQTFQTGNFACRVSGTPEDSQNAISSLGYVGEEFKLDRSDFRDEAWMVHRDFRPSSKESVGGNSTLPPRSQLSAESEESYDEKSNGVISLIDSKVVLPKKKPPSRMQIRSFLMENENFKEVTEIPFYGDPKDLTKSFESGPLNLKVETVGFAGLKTFKSDLDILGMEERRCALLNIDKCRDEKIRYLFSTEKDIVITPLKKPPSFSEVFESLSARKKPGDCERVKRSRAKVAMPSSPGQESHSEEEMDLSVSLSVSRGETGSQDGKGFSSGESGDSKDGQDLPPSGEASADEGSGSVRNPNKKTKKFKRISSALQTISEEPNSSSSDLFFKGVKASSEDSFRITGVTLENTYGFESSVGNMKNVDSSQAHQHVTMLVMEIHVRTRKDFRPDPRQDPIRALFYTVTFDDPEKSQETGTIVAGNLAPSDGAGIVHRVPEESDLILKLADLMKIWDPDILAGYEIEMSSWGYLIQRGFTLQLNLFSLLGRVKSEVVSSGIDENKTAETSESEGFDDAPRSVRHMRICGRIVLDVWRLLRHEVSLTSYTFENVMHHLSHERHPVISHQALSSYWEHSSNKFRHITVAYYVTRVTGIVRILDRLDFVNRTSEFARIFGIQFYEVLSRGSQFRVESMMLRLAKPLNFVAVSPSVGQRAAMRAPASLPLILEPESRFYSDPLIVLDFQSLYPSMIIAYNYCFSTCLGRVEKLGGREPFEFGCSQLQISPEELKDLENDITISPAGIAFVKANVRKGILPAMLEEILETRLMVKKSMKKNHENKLLQKLLFAQQLGLKLIANVTYGYTAANFSGRMPCIEVGDSVVSKGRETLHRAIQMVKNNPKWRARVVYGDTDSIFVVTPGRSREEAFRIGREIAEAVTQDNPKPVKLKLEKVYQPSILQTKKRYVGYMYESPEQKEPVFEAKGIETVRRDGCPAVGKILQKSLEILFDTRDVSLVKKYVIRQFSKLFRGRVNVQDLIFAKEYRGREGYRPGACVPALQLARHRTRCDKRAEPRVKERVAYVIVNGPPGVPLIKLVRSPADLIADPSLQINAFYYITKAIIPPLNRCFSLLGVDVATWYSEIPKKTVKRFNWSLAVGDRRKNTISQYFSTVECILCSNVCANNPICRDCQNQPQASAVGLLEKINRWERSHAGLAKICQTCCKSPMEINCESIDCPVLFRKTQASRDLLLVPVLRDLLENYL